MAPSPPPQVPRADETRQPTELPSPPPSVVFGGSDVSSHSATASAPSLDSDGDIDGDIAASRPPLPDDTDYPPPPGTSKAAVAARRLAHAPLSRVHALAALASREPAAAWAAGAGRDAVEAEIGRRERAERRAALLTTTTGRVGCRWTRAPRERAGGPAAPHASPRPAVTPLRLRWPMTTGGEPLPPPRGRGGWREKSAVGMARCAAAAGLEGASAAGTTAAVPEGEREGEGTGGRAGEERRRAGEREREGETDDAMASAMRTDPSRSCGTTRTNLSPPTTPDRGAPLLRGPGPPPPGAPPPPPPTPPPGPPPPRARIRLRTGRAPRGRKGGEGSRREGRPLPPPAAGRRPSTSPCRRPGPQRRWRGGVERRRGSVALPGHGDSHRPLWRGEGRRRRRRRRRRRQRRRRRLRRTLRGRRWGHGGHQGSRLRFPSESGACLRGEEETARREVDPGRSSATATWGARPCPPLPPSLLRSPGWRRRAAAWNAARTAAASALEDRPRTS